MAKRHIVEEPNDKLLSALKSASSSPYPDSLGYYLVDAGFRWAKATISPRAGGCLAEDLIFTMMDQVAGAAVMSGLAEMVPVMTVDLRIDFLRPLRSGEIWVEGLCTGMGDGLAHVCTKAYDAADHQPAALGMATFSYVGIERDEVA